MSDSLPPDEGPDPYEGQDLDGLLSGEDDCFPDGLRPVARTLDALRVAPMPAELAGEAAARADFRRIRLSGGSGPAWSAGGVGDSRTRILPTEAANGRPHPTARPHSHRRPPRRGRWQATALVGAAAAAVVIVGVTVLASTGSGGRLGQPGHSPGTASAKTQSAASGSHGVDGSAKPEATAKPTRKASNQSVAGTGADSDPGTLCSQYEFLTHPGPHESRMTESEFGQLSAQAGGPMNVSSYCMHVLQPWAKVPGNSPGAPGAPGAEFPPLVGAPGSQGAQEVNGPAGHSGTGNNGNGNSQGKNIPGFASP